MIKVIYQDSPTDGARDEFRDDEYADARGSFRVAAQHWAEVMMVLENDEDPQDWVLVHDWERSKPFPYGDL